jgi:hypothetical protein
MQCYWPAVIGEVAKSAGAVDIHSYNRKERVHPRAGIADDITYLEHPNQKNRGMMYHTKG